MARLQLCIFHYHLRPGGVTDVIMGWVRILASHWKNIFPQYKELSLQICCGNSDNIALLRSSNFDDLGLINPINNGDSRDSLDGLTLKFVIDKNLGYWEAAEPTYWQGHIDKLAEHLRQKYCAKDWHNLWWLHNYHLGKNPAYTQALLQIIRNQETPAPLNFLLQIHDFPECGRLSLYQSLRRAQREPDKTCCLYPAGTNICYGTINKRDYHILRAAGLPPESLFFLPNPLEFKNLQQLSAAGRPASRSEFNRQFKLADKLLALYPVRCIRRKNVLELAALNLMAGEPWNLICTLPGISAEEQPYSQLLEKLYKDGIIQGRCHIGLELKAQDWNFAMLCHAADLIVSSSVMEGFGFTYFNSIYWDKPLLARYLNVLQGFEHLFTPELAIFYHKLKIPLRRLDGTLDKKLAALYTELCQQYQNYARQFPFSAGEKLPQELQIAEPEYFDFALLSVAQQHRLLLRLQRAQSGDANSLLAACRRANANLLQGMQQLQTIPNCPAREARQRSRQQLVDEFAPPRLANILRRACAASLRGNGPALACDETSISQKVLQAFCKLEYNHAILWNTESVTLTNGKTSNFSATYSASRCWGPKL